MEALHAEKEVLRRSVSEKECELLSTRGLIEEKELQLSQEADKATREICELQGRLLEKVWCCGEPTATLLSRARCVWGVVNSCGSSTVTHHGGSWWTVTCPINNGILGPSPEKGLSRDMQVMGPR